MLYPWGFSSNDPSVTPEHECDLSVRKALRLNKYSRFYVPLEKYMGCLLDFFLHMSVFDKYIVHGNFFFSWTSGFQLLKGKLWTGLFL